MATPKTTKSEQSEDYDPEQYTYVSQRNWDRKQKIINGQANQLAEIVGQPGPIAGAVIRIFDAFVNFIARCMVFLLKITKYAFNLVNTYAFGNFNGIFPSTITGGKVYSLRFMRYIMTVLLPPFGVFLSKGLYGTFNVFICLILTYINYIAGIVYALVITMRNRYADQYEEYEYNVLKANNPDESIIPTDSTAFTGFVASVIILASVLVGFLYWF